MRKSVIKYRLLSDSAFHPIRATSKSAGLDLRSTIDIVVPGRGKVRIPSGIRVRLPKGCFGQIAPRSGLAWNHHIDIGAGVIDSDYSGEIFIVIFNHSSADYKITCGDKIAQLICIQCFLPEMKQSSKNKSGKLKITLYRCRLCSYVYCSKDGLAKHNTNKHSVKRNELGFGSTGK